MSPHLSKLPLFLLLSAAVSAQTSQPSQPGTRTIADLAESPTGQAPRSLSWSPDGTRLTYVVTEPETQGDPANFKAGIGDIVQVDTSTGASSLLASAKALTTIASAGASNAGISEQDRDHRARYNMSAFLWADDSKHLLLDQGGRLFVYALDSKTGTMIVDTKQGSGADAKFSPDAKSVSYLRNHNLYVYPVAGGTETALTNTTEPALLNGEVDWVYLEELGVRHNYFWAPDSKAIAYLAIDESKVPQYPISDWIPTHASVDLQRYPQPGDPNPNVRVAVVGAGGGTRAATPVYVTVPFSAGNDYIPRFGWVDPATVWVEVLTRDHQHRILYFADARTGQARKVFSDDDPKFLEENYDIHVLPHGQFLTTSWRDGHMHLYLFSFDEQHPMAQEARLVRQLTKGAFEVEDVHGLSPDGKTVFFTSSELSPLENNLWAINLDGSNKRKLTEQNGTHISSLAPDGKHFADTYNSRSTAPTASICSLSAKPACKPYWRPRAFDAASGVTIEPLELKAADGVTKLYAILERPTASGTNASTPLIMNPYGGPTRNGSVLNSWNNSGQIWSEWAAQHGMAVLHIENRGGGGRGREFEQAGYRNFGPVQLSDQLAVLDQVLARYPQFDAKRLGWWGWSWGGSFTLYAMTHSDRFKAGVAGAPVTDWRNYDSIYTERYLGLPDANAGIYKTDSPITQARQLHGHLLIAHGTGDDNVHLENTIQFLQPLIDAGIPYDLQLFPRKTHSVAGKEAQMELNNRVLLHFETYLK